MSAKLTNKQAAALAAIEQLPRGQWSPLPREISDKTARSLAQRGLIQRRYVPIGGGMTNIIVAPKVSA